MCSSHECPPLLACAGYPSTQAWQGDLPLSLIDWLFAHRGGCERGGAIRQVMLEGSVASRRAGSTRTMCTAPEHLFFLVDSELPQQARQAAEATRGEVAPWLRHMLREITVRDFPGSWRAGQASRQGAEEAAPMSLGRTAGASCDGLMSRRGRYWSLCLSTSKSRAPRSFASASPRRRRRRFRRAGSSRLTSEGDRQGGVSDDLAWCRSRRMGVRESNAWPARGVGGPQCRVSRAVVTRRLHRGCGGRWPSRGALGLLLLARAPVLTADVTCGLHRRPLQRHVPHHLMLLRHPLR